MNSCRRWAITFRNITTALVVLSLSQAKEYGVDVSFPMQHNVVSQDSQELGPNKQEFYNGFIQGCRDYFGKYGSWCDDNEMSRIKLNLEQPSRMKNFTSQGYDKLRLPENTMKLLLDFWENNKDRQRPEKWQKGNTFTNQWESKTSTVFINHATNKGGGQELANAVQNAVQPILEAWTNTHDLKLRSVFGIRVYHNGSILAPHVDRNPLIISAIINVAQDVDEPWPLEVIAHDGIAHNVTIQPGDLVLYESHSVLHGRPFPLKGRYFANVFVHFEPPGYTQKYGFTDEL